MPKPDKPTCGQPKSDGTPCSSTILRENGRCRAHGGGAGAPAGNQNARKHGLFAKVLGPIASEVYEHAKTLPVEELAREVAYLVAGKVAEAYRSDKPWQEASGLAQEIIGTLVAKRRISPEMADMLAARLDAPDLATLGKAIAPLKGLLELKRPEEAPNVPGSGSGAAGDSDALARGILEGLGEAPPGG